MKILITDAVVEKACGVWWNHGTNQPHPNPWPAGAEPLTQDIREAMRATLEAVFNE